MDYLDLPICTFIELISGGRPSCRICLTFINNSSEIETFDFVGQPDLMIEEIKKVDNKSAQNQLLQMWEENIRKKNELLSWADNLTTVEVYNYLHKTTLGFDLLKTEELLKIFKFENEYRKEDDNYNKSFIEYAIETLKSKSSLTHNLNKTDSTRISSPAIENHIEHQSAQPAMNDVTFVSEIFEIIKNNIFAIIGDNTIAPPKVESDNKYQKILGEFTNLINEDFGYFDENIFDYEIICFMGLGQSGCNNIIDMDRLVEREDEALKTLAIYKEAFFEACQSIKSVCPSFCGRVKRRIMSILEDKTEDRRLAYANVFADAYACEMCSLECIVEGYLKNDYKLGFLKNEMYLLLEDASAAFGIYGIDFIELLASRKLMNDSIMGDYDYFRYLPFRLKQSDVTKKGLQSGSLKMPQKHVSFSCNLSDAGRQYLFEELKKDGFISPNTNYHHFAFVFGGNKPDDFEPLQWIKTNRTTKGKTPNKRALLELLVLLDIDKAEIKNKKLINALFNIPTGSEFKSNNYTDITDAKGDFKDFKSDYHDELSEIASKSKEK